MPEKLKIYKIVKFQNFKLSNFQNYETYKSAYPLCSELTSKAIPMLPSTQLPLNRSYLACNRFFLRT